MIQRFWESHTVHQRKWIIILSISSFRCIAATVETHRRMWIIIFSMSSFRRDHLSMGSFRRVSATVEPRRRRTAP